MACLALGAILFLPLAWWFWNPSLLDKSEAMLNHAKKNTDQPTTDQQPDQPTTDQQPDQPTTDQQPDQPTTDQQPDQPTTDQQPDQPTTDQQPDQPTTDQQPDQPTTDQRPDQPTTDQQPDQPTTDQARPADHRPAARPADHRPAARPADHDQSPTSRQRVLSNRGRQTDVSHGRRCGLAWIYIRLRVEEPSSSRCRPDPFWLLTSAGSSSQCVPDLPCYGRGNDQENDRADPREAHPSITASDPDRKAAAPRTLDHRDRSLIIDQGPSDR